MNVLERANHSPEILRKKREKVFKAFDIYKQNVNYGILTESNEQHEAITLWYRKCLDLDYEAINNIPVEIEVYLQ